MKPSPPTAGIRRDAPRTAPPSAPASALARSLGILRFVAAAAAAPSLAEVVTGSGLPKATAHRLLVALEAQGYLRREPGGRRYGIGPALGALARDALRHGTAQARRHRILAALVDEIGETCNLTMPDGTEVLYLDRVEAPWHWRLALDAGSHVPLHCTASGKLFLSLMPAAERRELLRILPLKRYTDRTLVSARALERALAPIRAERLGVDDEEFVPGLVAIAVPVVDGGGRACAALAVHAPTLRVRAEALRRFVPALRRAAVAIGRALAP